MRTLQDRYDGERAFLVGNGPSLDQTPLDQLNNEYCFAMNKINDIYTDTDWRPSFYVLLVDDLEEIEPEYLIENSNKDIKCVTLEKFKPTFGDDKNIYYTNKKKLKYESVEGSKRFHDLRRSEVESINICQLYNYWPDDISEMIYTYHSMYAIIQMAIYMGFDELYLVGCDLGYGYHDPHMIFESGLDPYDTSEGKWSFIKKSYHKKALSKSIANGMMFKILTSSIVDMIARTINYFVKLNDTNRFDSYSQLRPEDLSYVDEEITKSHIAAQRIASDQGVDIYNATMGGELEVYPRVTLENITGC
ncbi:6-hydroxymethylpterin diphosphokinase MptE-like protein [Halosegnis longus]|uniref:6-hydroxymethylpterin diphosphokinase MptE-like protein n=1 Tax=Halosegnis longus TaxID=2216012 RepID=UPI001356730B|nr:6-hydroxymethylpterin diphosphokinase MptE-like protein [Salella cibi]